MSQTTLRTTECGSANARYHKVLAVPRRIVKAWQEENDDQADTVVKLCELLDQGRKVAVPSHPGEFAKLITNVAFATNSLEVKDLELHM